MVLEVQLSLRNRILKPQLCLQCHDETSCWHRDAELAASSEVLEQALDSSVQLQSAMRELLFDSSGDCSQIAGSRCSTDSQVIQPGTPGGCNESNTSAHYQEHQPSTKWCSAGASSCWSGQQHDAAATVAAGCSLQDQLQRLEAAEAAYDSTAAEVVDEVVAALTLLSSLKPHLKRLSKLVPRLHPMLSSVGAASSDLQAALAAASAGSKAELELHKQQHAELQAQLQKVQSLQQLAADTKRHIAAAPLLTQQYDKAADDLDVLELEMKRAKRWDQLRMPVLQRQAEAVKEKLQNSRRQLAALKQHLHTPGLQRWYPELRKQLAGLVSGGSGVAAAAAAIGGMPAAQLVVAGNRVPALSDFTTIRVMQCTPARRVRGRAAHLKSMGFQSPSGTANIHPILGYHTK